MSRVWASPAEKSIPTHALVATSTNVLRRSNTLALLKIFSSASAGKSFTTSELIELSDLTRSTILAVCDDLLAAGWIAESDAGPRVEGTRGRPSRRFALNPGAAHVVGVDLGFSSVTCVVADLLGQIVGRSRRAFHSRPDSPEWIIDRTAETQAAVDESLHDAGAEAGTVLAATLAVPAPVDHTGRVGVGDEFWDWIRIDPDLLFSGHPEWPIVVENDANLAALAEREAMSGPAQSLVVLLAGDRFGAGIVENGVLHRGHHGGGGEMKYLSLIEGVGSTVGIGRLAQDWAQDAVGDHLQTKLTSESVAADVFRLGEEGDDVAHDISGRLLDRLARVIATLVSLLDPGRIVLGGGVATSLQPLIPELRLRVEEHTAFASELLASPLASDIVIQGAVHAALAHVWDHALKSSPSAPTAIR
ncbi:ROK family protein [Leifsonia poae]|uniref:ROK family protein n=1 Tax=Leifsonia poae TaxID=110933 RepID=UPI001CBB9943|nr:ROK family protein [Leifsonia poae]